MGILSDQMKKDGVFLLLKMYINLHMKKHYCEGEEKILRDSEGRHPPTAPHSMQRK